MRPVIDPLSPLKSDPRGRAFDLIAGGAVVLIALGVRLWYLAQLRSTPLFTQIQLDPAYYLAWARRIAAGDWLSGTEVFEQSPLYAYILGVIFRFAGDGLLVPRLVQAALGSLTCLLVFLIARRLLGRPAALAAGLLAALYAPSIFYDGMIMKPSWSVFLTAAMTAALVHSEGSRRSFLFGAGACLGLASLASENLILLAPLLALWLVLDVKLRGGMTRGWLLEASARTLWIGAGCILAIAPVTARNVAVSGEWVLLTSGGGEVFYIGNNPDSDGRYSPPPFVRAMSGAEHEDFRKEAERRAGRSLTRRDASMYWIGEGLRWIRSDPAGWGVLLATKLRIFLNAYELPDNQNFDHHRAFVPVLRYLPTWGLLLPLAAAGLVLSARAWRDLLPLWVIAAGYTGTILLFFNFARFRMPLVPVLIVFAGEGLAGLPALLRPPLAPLRAGAAAGAAAVAALFALVPIPTDPLHRGQAESQMADLLARAGRLDEARPTSDRGIELLESIYAEAGGTRMEQGAVAPPGVAGRPPLGDSYYGILMESLWTRSRIERALGDEEEALRWSARAAAAAPDSIVGRTVLTAHAEALIARGRLSEALQPVLRARRADPVAIRPALVYAQILHRTGRPLDAIRIVEAALDANPALGSLDRADASYGLGLAFRDLGDTARMRFHFREALSLNPAHPAADRIRSLLAEADRRERLVGS